VSVAKVVPVGVEKAWQCCSGVESTVVVNLYRLQESLRRFQNALELLEVLESPPSKGMVTWERVEKMVLSIPSLRVQGSQPVLTLVVLQELCCMG
jgi:hypothetical protein